MITLILDPPRQFAVRTVTVRIPGQRRQFRRWWKQPVPQQQTAPPDPHLGYVAVYECGRRLGLICGIGQLESWIMARPGRLFELLFVHPKPMNSDCLRPVCCVYAEAQDGQVVYHHTED